MKGVSSLLIILVALRFTLQAMATIDTSKTPSTKSYITTTDAKFPYSAKRESGSGASVKLLATEINPDLYQEVTLRLECRLARGVSRKAKLEKAAIKFRIPKGIEIVSGDTLWIGSITRGQTLVREIVIKPIEREYFLCCGSFDVEGYYIDGEKRYPPSGYKTIDWGSNEIKIQVKGAPSPRVKRISQVIEKLKKELKELKKELKEIEEGKAPEDTSGHPPWVRWGPPWLNVAPRLDATGREVAPCDSVYQDSLSVLLDSLQQEYERLSDELYRKKNPGIGKPLKLNELAPEGSYDLQAVKEGKAKRTQFFKS